MDIITYPCRIAVVCRLISARNNLTGTMYHVEVVIHATWPHCVLWWRHQMETFSALLAIYAGNSPVPAITVGMRLILKFIRKVAHQWRWFYCQTCKLLSRSDNFTSIFSVGSLSHFPVLNTMKCRHIFSYMAVNYVFIVSTGYNILTSTVYWYVTSKWKVPRNLFLDE